jgi:hypothetical protein
MYMFIANGTHQNIDFQYRLPKTKNYRAQMIPIGQQIRISGELSREDVDAIIFGHQIYGMIAANEISRFKGFHIPYVYSLDGPVSAEIIAELIIQNREYNDRLGRQLREEAAVTVSDQIEKNTTDTLKSLEMTIEELPSKDRDVSFSEGIRVTRDRERGAPQGPDGINPPLDLFSRNRIIRPSF